MSYLQPPDPPEEDGYAMAEAMFERYEKCGYAVISRDEWKSKLDDAATDGYAEGRKDEREEIGHKAACFDDLLGALKSAEYAVNVTRACLMDSVETHGTHGGWLHTEALRLDSELDLIRAAIAKATGSEA